MPTTSGVVIFVDTPGLRSLPPAAALHIAAAGLRPVVVSGKEQALQLVETLASDRQETLRFLVTNSPDFELFEATRKGHPDAITILVAGESIDKYAKSLKNQDHVLLDHVIANTHVDWVTDELRVTLQKLIRKDYFGIEKYLTLNTPIHERTITSSRDREAFNAEVQQWIETNGQSKSIGRLAFGITEELIMNVVYDAPVAGGRLHYEKLERHEARDLAPDEYAKLRYGSDGSTIAISTVDPFGAFEHEKWLYYTRKILRRDDTDNLIDTKKGGAGLGLFKMLYSSHGVVCNVEPGKRTEVIVLIDLRHALKDFAQMPRSIHYFRAK